MRRKIRSVGKGALIEGEDDEVEVMFDVISQTAVELVVSASGSGGASLVEPAGGRDGVVLNQTSGVDTIFALIQTLTNYIILGVVAVCVPFFAYGAYLLIRAAGNPQQLERARSQMIYSGVAGALAVGSFLIIGTFLDVADDAAGGALIDVGNVVVSEADQAGEVRQEGEPLGIYAGKAVRCTAEVVGADGDPANKAAALAWTWANGSDGADGTCTRK